MAITCISHDQSCDLYPAIPDGCPIVLVAVVCDNVEVWGPELKLSLPVDNRRERSADEERTVGVTLQVRKKDKSFRRTCKGYYVDI